MDKYFQIRVKRRLESAIRTYDERLATLEPGSEVRELLEAARNDAQELLARCVSE